MDGNFKTILEMVDYLTGQGWKIRKSKAYDDNRAGLIRRDPDGGISKKEADIYAAKFLKRLDNGGINPAVDGVKLVRQADVEAGLDALRKRIRKFSQERAGGFIRLAEGKAENNAAVSEYLEGVMLLLFDRFAASLNFQKSVKL